MNTKQNFTKEDFDELVKEKELLLKEGRILREKMLKLLDKQKIKKVQNFISKQPNN